MRKTDLQMVFITSSLKEAKKIASKKKHRLACFFKKEDIRMMRCLKPGCGASLIEYDGRYFGSALTHSCENQHASFSYISCKSVFKKNRMMKTMGIKYKSKGEKT